MQKIVINVKPGGFSLSHDGLMFYAKLKSLNLKTYCKSAGDIYEIYKKKIGEQIPEHLLFHCVLPGGEEFPLFVDDKFLTSYMLKTSYCSFLLEKDGNFLLNSFRSESFLVQVVEELNSLAFGEYANLKVVSVPCGVIWEILSLDSGVEIIKEVSREWM